MTSGTPPAQLPPPAFVGWLATLFVLVFAALWLRTVERFDRDGDRRIPFLSARSLIGAHGRGSWDYLELVDAMPRNATGKIPKHELRKTYAD